MLTIGMLCSGGLGLDTLTKIHEVQSIEFVLTDSNSIGIIDYAEQNNIPCFAGNPRDGRGFNFISSFDVDIIASINYLFLIEEDIINHSNKLTFNIHGSLLPKYRGRTPHVWAIINGEKSAGITAHVIDSGCDTGQIISQIEIPITEDDTGATMLEKYAKEYAPLVQKIMREADNDDIKLVDQIEADATYFGKRTPLDGEINWNWTKESIRNWIRAQADPYPGAFTFYNGTKIILDKVSFSNMKVKDIHTNGEIISTSPSIVVATKNGAINLDVIRTENCTFAEGNKFSNENRK